MKKRRLFWMAVSVFGACGTTAAIYACLPLSLAEAVQASGALVLLLVTVSYVVATQDLLGLERQRVQDDRTLLRAQAAQQTLRNVRALLKTLDDIQRLAKADSVEKSLRAIRSRVMTGLIVQARSQVEDVIDARFEVIDREVEAGWGASTGEATEYAEVWLDVLELIRSRGSADLETILAEAAAVPSMRLKWFQGATAHTEPVVNDVEGVVSGRWAGVAAQVVFNASDALREYVEQGLLR